MQERRRSSGKPPDDSATDTDSDGERIRSRKSERVQKALAQRKGDAQKLAQSTVGPFQPSKRKPNAGKTRANSISLQQLVEQDLLQPGKAVLTVEYKSQCIKADLRQDGAIVYEYGGIVHTFESPSAFSIAVKRQINPSRKADDGWKTVKFQGKFLEYYKKKLQSGGKGKTDIVQPAKRAKLNGNSSAAEPSQKEALPGQKHLSNGKHMPGPALAVVGSNLEDISVLAPCQQFAADPDDPTRSAQPFAVHLSSSAALLMDLHSHLSDNEVIGILTGRWDSEAQALRIERAYPVQERNSREDTGMVAMDEASQAEILNILSTPNLRCVGWYHSHPHAHPDPSPTDIAFQIRLQHSEGPGPGALPQFAIIVSPFNCARIDGQAGMTLFQAKAGGSDPSFGKTEAAAWQAIEFKFTERPSRPDDPFLEELQQHIIEDTVKQCYATSRHADLSKTWKEAVSTKQKLLQSMSARLPSEWNPEKVGDFVHGVEELLAKAESALPKAKKEEDPEISQSTASESENEQKQRKTMALGVGDGQDTSSNEPNSTLNDSIKPSSNETIEAKQSTQPQEAPKPRLLSSLNGGEGKEGVSAVGAAAAGSSGTSGGAATQELSGLEGKHFFDSDPNLEGLDSLPEIDSLGRLEDLSKDLSQW